MYMLNKIKELIQQLEDIIYSDIEYKNHIEHQQILDEAILRELRIFHEKMCGYKNKKEG